MVFAERRLFSEAVTFLTEASITYSSGDHVALLIVASVKGVCLYWYKDTLDPKIKKRLRDKRRSVSLTPRSQAAANGSTEPSSLCTTGIQNISVAAVRSFHNTSKCRF